MVGYLVYLKFQTFKILPCSYPGQMPIFALTISQKNNKMKKTLLLILLACLFLPAMAQKNAPKWFDKQRKAIVQVTAYGSDNQVLQTGVGVFVSESGDLLAGYSIFKSAARATVTDTDGKEYPVLSVMGADDMYDVIKVKVSVPKKVPFFPIASEPLPTGTVSYQVPYVAGKTGSFQDGTIMSVEKLKESFGYYKISIPLEGSQMDAPLLTADGQLFGLAQKDASGRKEYIYAMSAGYINSLQISSLDMLSSTYTSIGIRKAWPADPEQAEVMLYLLASSQSGEAYLATLNDYITTFPNEISGYQSRASYYAYDRPEQGSTPASSLDKAMADIETAVRLNPDKAEGLYTKAKLIYGVAASDTTLTDSKWSMQAAMYIVQEAIRTKDSPLYHQLEGDIYYYQGDYQKAFDSYMIMNNSEKASPASYYSAAKAKENIPGHNVFDVITLLSSAYDKSKDNPTPETLVYLMERIEYRMQVMQYDEAIADYDAYYNLLGGQVNDSFFYFREQAKFRKGDLTGALSDIYEAVKLAPNNPTYLAEEASVYIRMEKYTEALASLQKTIALAPDFAACYRLQGLCYVRQGKKAEGCTAFQKAKELGDPVVDRLIKEHCQ